MNYYWGSLFDIDTTNENCPELIRLLLSLSDAFQVVLANHRVSDKLPAASRKFKEALKRDKVGGWSKTGDYSLPMTEGTTQPGKYCTTAIFQVSPDSFPVLEARQSLSNWYLPESPEDLSFYRNGRCWFAACAEEGIVYFCANQEDAQKIIEYSGIPFSKGAPAKEEELFQEEYKLRKR